MTRTPASKLADAADALLDWLHSQSPPTGRHAGASLPSPDVARPDPDRHPTAQAAPVLPPVDPPRWPPERPGPGADTQAVRAQAAPLRLAHTDWLYHHLTVAGPADGVAIFARAAAGAGVIPWALDLDRLAEDFFTRSSPHRPRSNAASAWPAPAFSPASWARRWPAAMPWRPPGSGTAASVRSTCMRCCRSRPPCSAVVPTTPKRWPGCGRIGVPPRRCAMSDR